MYNENLYIELLENDLNPFILFKSDGKLKSYNKEAEFLLNFVNIKELFDLAVSNASLNFGFNQKYIKLQYNKQNYYAILVGYINEDEIALRLYKSVSNKTNHINSHKLELINIFRLIELSKDSILINSSLKVDELYDISIPDIKLNINEFLLLLNDCFTYFIDEEKIILKVNMKLGEYKIIDEVKYKILALEFISDKKIDIDYLIDIKATRSNADIYFLKNKLIIELPMILN